METELIEQRQQRPLQRTVQRATSAVAVVVVVCLSINDDHCQGFGEAK